MKFIINRMSLFSEFNNQSCNARPLNARDTRTKYAYVNPQIKYYSQSGSEFKVSYSLLFKDLGDSLNKIVYKNQETYNFALWLVGFVDGEGTFSVDLNKNETMKTGLQIQLAFIITRQRFRIVTTDTGVFGQSR